MAITVDAVTVHTAYIVGGLITLIGNGLIILVVALYKKIRGKETILLAGLAGADFLNGAGHFLAGSYRLNLSMNNVSTKAKVCEGILELKLN